MRGAGARWQAGAALRKKRNMENAPHSAGVRSAATGQPSHRTAGVGTGAGMGTCPPWLNSNQAALNIHVKVSIKGQYSAAPCKCELLTTWWSPVRRCTVQWHGHWRREHGVSCSTDSGTAGHTPRYLPTLPLALSVSEQFEVKS